MAPRRVPASLSVTVPVPVLAPVAVAMPAIAPVPVPVPVLAPVLLILSAPLPVPVPVTKLRGPCPGDSRRQASAASRQAQKPRLHCLGRGGAMADRANGTP